MPVLVPYMVSCAAIFSSIMTRHTRMRSRARGSSSTASRSRAMRTSFSIVSELPSSVIDTWDSPFRSPHGEVSLHAIICAYTTVPRSARHAVPASPASRDGHAGALVQIGCPGAGRSAPVRPVDARQGRAGNRNGRRRPRSSGRTSFVRRCEPMRRITTRRMERPASRSSACLVALPLVRGRLRQQVERRRRRRRPRRAPRRVRRRRRRSRATGRSSSTARRRPRPSSPCCRTAQQFATVLKAQASSAIAKATQAKVRP